MKKASLNVFLGMAGIFIAVALTACNQPFGIWVYDSVSITKNPNKLTYIVGELFNPSGLEVKAKIHHTGTGAQEENTYKYNNDPGKFSFDIPRDTSGIYYNNDKQLPPGNRNITVSVVNTKASPYNNGSGSTALSITVTKLQENGFEAWVRLPPDQNTIAIIGYSGAGGDITLPSQIGGKSVAGVRQGVFNNKKNLTGVTIPNTFTSIWESAFSGCTNLASVTIGSGVTSIWSNAFKDCTSLASINIPDSVTRIGDYVFSGCTNLTSVTIGNGLTSIGILVFGSCTSLTAINVGTGNTAYSSQDGILYDKAKTELILIPQGLTGNVNIPDSVTSMGYFSGRTGITSVTIGNGVTSIEKMAFSGCTGLTSVTIGNGVTSIGDYVFAACTNLTSVTFQGTIPSTGFSNSFYGFGDLKTKYLAGGPGTYTTTSPVSNTSVWTKQ